MKKAILFLIAFLSVFALIFTSCSNEASFDTEGALVVSISGGQSRGLLPSASMEIARYDLTVNDASGKKVATATLGKTSTGMSFSMPAGTYSVFVEAKNSDGVVIGQGSVEATVTAGKTNAVTVIITECAGNGTFAVSISANAGYGLELRIYDLCGDEKYKKELKYQDGRFVTDGTVSLANGFYRFEMVRTDTNAVIKGSSLRIMKDVATTYEATFSFLSDGSMAIVNEILNIPAIEITLTKNTVNQSENLEATATISGIENYTTCWFIDGNALGTFGAYSDLSQDISTLSPGTHELELYVKNSQIMWSEYKTFTVEEAEAILLLVPTFDASAGNGSRGLTDMFNDDTYFACFDPDTDENALYKNLYLSYGVMTTTPITPTLRAVSNVKLTKSAVNSLKTTLSFNSYGFNVEVEDIGIDFLEHEILIKYNIVENKAVVGTGDYVYNWREKTFSFRECVMLTLFGDTVPEPAYTLGALILEMHDIKLDTDIFGIPTGGYSTGSFKDGVIEKNAWVDFFNYGETSSNGNDLWHPLNFTRSYLTISSRNGKLYSMAQPKASVMKRIKIEEMDPENPIYKTLVDSGFVIIRDREYLDAYDWNHFNSDDFQNFSAIDPHSIKMDFFWNLADLIYSNSKILRSTDLTDLSKPLIPVDKYDHTDNSEEQMFTSYDVDTKTGAALQLTGSKWLFTLLSDSIYEYCNFDSFDNTVYRSYAADASHREIMDGLISDHLKACGITDPNYIKNYQTAYRYYELYGNGQFILDVTCEDPVAYKARLDAAVKEEKGRFLKIEYKNMTFIHNDIELGENASGSWGNHSGYGPFIHCEITVHIQASDGRLTNLVFASGSNDASDQVLYISFPNTITSIADGLLDALTSLKEVEVSKDFDTSKLPDGVTVTIR